MVARDLLCQSQVSAPAVPRPETLMTCPLRAQAGIASGLAAIPGAPDHRRRPYASNLRATFPLSLIREGYRESKPRIWALPPGRRPLTRFANHRHLMEQFPDPK